MHLGCILRVRLQTVAEFDGRVIAMPINDAAFEYLLARAGLVLTDAEKAELKTVCDGIAAMAERVRKPRGRMAEPALTYGFAEEDLR